MWGRFAHLLAFQSAWMATRDKRLWLLACPLVVVIAIPIIVLLFAFHGKTKLSARYHMAADNAFRRRQYHAAELWFQKLWIIDRLSDEEIYQSAIVAQRLEKSRLAMDRMNRIAGVHDAGFPPAHVWIAKRLIINANSSGKVRPGKEDVLKQAERHLQHATSSNKLRGEVQRLLAVVYHQSGRLDNAVQCLKEIVDDHPELRLTLAKLLIRTGRQREGKNQLRLLLAHYQREYDKGAITLLGIQRWSEAEVLLGNYAQSERILKLGLETFDSDGRIRHWLLSLYAQWHDSLSPALSNHGETRLSILDKALAIDPSNAPAINRLSRLVHGDDAWSEAAREKLSELLASSQATSTTHLIVGTIAAANGDQHTASIHLRQAHKLDDQSPIILNNLAWHIANSRADEMPRALKLANRAVELDPKSPSIRETRGQILAKLCRWEEAVADLEFVLGTRLENAAIHQTLATAYEQLGARHMANAHRRQLRKRESQRSR